MRAMAQCRGTTPIGCTQMTEIKCTEGVTLVGPLPKEFELATAYSIAVCAGASQADLAQRFARLVCGADAIDEREEAGFEA